MGPYLPSLACEPLLRRDGACLEAGGRLNTIHHIGSLLRQALQYAVKWGIISQNPADLVDLPPRQRKEPELWTPEQAATFLDEAKRCSKYHLLYAMAITTGLRAGELLGIRVPIDLDLSRGILFVRGGKTENARRSVLLPPTLLQEIKEYLREEPHIGYLFCTRKGTPLNLSNVRFQDFWPTIGKAGLPRIRFHDLRHFHASYILSRGVDLATVSGRLGHASKAFTAQTYIHAIAPRYQEQAAQVANDLLMSPQLLPATD